MREIFNSYTLTELRKIAVEYNKNVKISGVSKMKKEELINEMMKHQQHFKDLKPKPKKIVKSPEQKKQDKKDEDERLNKKAYRKIVNEFVKPAKAEKDENEKLKKYIAMVRKFRKLSTPFKKYFKGRDPVLFNRIAELDKVVKSNSWEKLKAELKY